MRSSFVINLGNSMDNRPPISYKILKYFELFIEEHVLIKKKIIINSKWNIWLVIHFTGKGPKVLFKEMSLAQRPRTVSADKVKIYYVFIHENLLNSSQNHPLRTIEVMYDSIKLFFTTIYPKVQSEFMDELWNNVDLDYLLSLPYPAPLEEQEYIGD